MNKEELITLLLEELKLSNTENLQQQKMNFVIFNEKEIMKMPPNFRKSFRANGCTAHYRKRTDGRYNCSYEIRYSKKPYNNPPISVSGKTLKEAKQRFIEKLSSYVPGQEQAINIPKKFNEFAKYWFENFHKRKVCDATFRETSKLYTRHIENYFANVRIDNVNAVFLQNFLDLFNEKGKTKDDLRSLLNQIFNSAVKHGLIALNPLNMVFHKRHEKKHGSALTKENEATLLQAYVDTPYFLQFAVILYTGLRPGEYSSAQLAGNFIKARNSKRANGAVEFKLIPITPKLKPYLSNVPEETQLITSTPNMLERRFKRIFPERKLYDLRTTFQTRLTECGVSDVAIGLVMGNSIGCALKTAYTDVSNEWLFKELQKFNY